jgi:hypothetical protein
MYYQSRCVSFDRNALIRPNVVFGPVTSEQAQFQINWHEAL